MKSLLNKIITVVLTVTMCISSSVYANTEEVTSKSETLNYENGTIYKTTKERIGVEYGKTRGSYSETWLYKTVVVQANNVVRPTVEMGAKVKIYSSGPYGQIKEVIRGSEYCRAYNSNTTWDTWFINASVVDSGLNLNMSCRGQLTVTTQYAFNLGLQAKDLVNAGFEYGGSNIYRYTTNLGVKIPLY